MARLYFEAVNPLTAKCQIYPVQQKYCVRQLPDMIRLVRAPGAVFFC